MSEIDLLRRIEALEKKVEELETTINTIGMIEKSERISEYLRKRKRNQSLVSLVNSISDEEIVINSAINEKTKRLVYEKEMLEKQIEERTTRMKDDDDNPYSEDLFKIEYDNKNGIIVTGYNGFDMDTIVIPSIICGRPVVRIGSSAFNSVSCERIIIPDTVTEIEQSAFSSNFKLKRVDFGKNIKSIGNYAFSSCKSLVSLVFPASVEYLGKECFAFSGIERVVLSSNIKTIPEGCFHDCKTLKEITIPEGVLNIDKNAFDGCFSLKEMIIPRSAKTVSKELLGIVSVCKLAFLGNETDWKDKNEEWVDLYYHVVFCNFGSKILQSSRKLGFEIHPLSEFFDS